MMGSLFQRITVVQGDITAQRVDAIVNAANTTLLGGGGVDGTIHRAAGPDLLDACRALNGCPTGQAKITPGFLLPAAHVIHTAGPVWRDGSRGEPELLTKCYRNSLQLAAEHRLASVAFPSISTGAYRFPVARASRIAVAEVTQWLERCGYPEEVIFVCFGDDVMEAYHAALQEQSARTVGRTRLWQV